MVLAARLRNDFNGVQRLAGASGLLLAGRVIGAASTFLFAVVLARTLPPAEVGLALTAIATSSLASVLVTLNIESGSIRFLVAARETGNAATVNGFILFGRLLLLAATPFVAGAYIAFSLFETGGADYLVMTACAAAAIPAMGWLRLSGAHATAFGHPAIGSLPRTALQPLLRLGFYPAALLLGAPASPGLALFCFFLAFAIAAIVQFLLIRTRLRLGSTTEHSFAERRSWILNGFYISPIILLQDYLQHAVIMIAAFALAPADVAVLAIAMRFIALVRFGVLSVTMASSPKISQAMARDDHKGRDEQLRAAALLKTPAAIAAAAGIIFFAGPLLALFGPEYAEGGRALAWFTAIPLASAVFGPNQMLLNIAGARPWVFGVSLAALLTLFLAVPTGGGALGLEGAAMAASLTYVAWELALFLVVCAKLRINGSFFAVFERGRASRLEQPKG